MKRLIKKISKRKYKNLRSKEVGTALSVRTKWEKNGFWYHHDTKTGKFWRTPEGVSMIKTNLLRVNAGGWRLHAIYMDGEGIPIYRWLNGGGDDLWGSDAVYLKNNGESDSPEDIKIIAEMISSPSVRDWALDHITVIQ